MTINICLGGATGWAGAALSRGIHDANDINLISAVSRSQAGKKLGSVLNIDDLNAQIFSSVVDALVEKPDVYFEYTKPDIAKSNIIAALNVGCHVVVGTSGLSESDYLEIDEIARNVKRGVLAVGNFAITVVLLQKFAEMAANYIDHWEIIDYAHADKIDAPSGTARELASRLFKVKKSKLNIPIDEIHGSKESRGVNLNGSQVHSIRLPGYVISIDAIFGMHDQKLILRHESGTSAEPYVDGALLAIRNVSKLIGVHRGLDTVMKFK